jgi:hypothetical protein
VCVRACVCSSQILSPKPNFTLMNLGVYIMPREETSPNTETSQTF